MGNAKQHKETPKRFNSLDRTSKQKITSPYKLEVFKTQDFGNSRDSLFIKLKRQEGIKLSFTSSIEYAISLVIDPTVCGSVSYVWLHLVTSDLFQSIMVRYNMISAFDCSAKVKLSTITDIQKQQ